MRLPRGRVLFAPAFVPLLVSVSVLFLEETEKVDEENHHPYVGYISHFWSEGLNF